MDRVYIVTSGAYSDYHIEGVFASLEAAESVAKRIRDANDIQEWPLCEKDPGRVKIYRVTLDLNGNEESRRSYIRERCAPDIQEDVLELAESYGGLCVMGSSPRGYDVALKIARDELARLKAEKEGIA